MDILHKMGELLEFVGEKGISSFSKFFSSTEEGVDVVLGCYLGVVHMIIQRSVQGFCV